MQRSDCYVTPAVATLTTGEVVSSCRNIRAQLLRLSPVKHTHGPRCAHPCFLFLSISKVCTLFLAVNSKTTSGINETIENTSGLSACLPACRFGSLAAAAVATFYVHDGITAACFISMRTRWWWHDDVCHHALAGCRYFPLPGLKYQRRVIIACRSPLGNRMSTTAQQPTQYHMVSIMCVMNPHRHGCHCHHRRRYALSHWFGATHG